MYDLKIEPNELDPLVEDDQLSKSIYLPSNGEKPRRYDFLLMHEACDIINFIEDSRFSYEQEG